MRRGEGKGDRGKREERRGGRQTVFIFSAKRSYSSSKSCSVGERSSFVGSGILDASVSMVATVF